MKTPKEVKPFWFDYGAQVPVYQPEAEDFRDAWRETVGHRMRVRMQELRLGGKKISGNVPFGWDDAGDGSLVPNDIEQSVIGRIRSLRDEGASFRGIAAHLKADGVKTKRGLDDWTAATIRGVLIRDGQMKAGE